MRKILGCILLLCSTFAYSQTITPSGPISYCVSGPLTVSGHGSSTVQWQLNGTDIAGATSATHTATVSGSYTAIISGTPQPDTLGPVAVTISQMPTAGFTFNPNNQCSNIPVVFTNTSTGTALSYSWNFGDPNSGAANTSTSTHPTHEFIGTTGNGNQSFTVSLTTTSGVCIQTSTQTVTTTQNPSTALGGPGLVTYDGKKYFKVCSNVPSANFNFTNLSTTSNTNYIIKWGDGSPDYVSTTFSAPVSHTFNVGITQMLFIVTGTNGCTDTATYYAFVGSNPAVGLENPGNTAICTNNTLTFPISGTATNPPGTVYTVTFNDGTPPISLTHPVPADISHTFTLSSCGAVSPGYNNAFNASIQASNPCASSTAIVVPIYVSEDVSPTFTISPNDTVCVNTPVTITNTTGSNYSIDNGTCNTAPIIWTISPSTGYTLSGTLGNDFGFTDPSVWQPGSDILNITFNTVGVYTIKLKTGNATCGLDSVIRTICVNPTPTGSFTVNEITGCAPLDVSTTSTTNTPLCGANTYQWTISYAPTAGCSPASSGYTFIGGTSATSAEPDIRFTNPGIYTLNLWLIAPAQSCSTLVDTRTIIVKGRPNINIGTLPADICQGTSFNVNATASCDVTNATYTWSFPGATPSSAGILGPVSITYNTPGNQTITLSATNECGTTTDSEPITVKPVPQLNLPANITRCAGESIASTPISATPSGTTITWTNSNTAIGLPASGSGNLPAFTATNSSSSAITSTITVTGLLNGCSISGTFTITIYPLPAMPAATSPVNYCQGNTAVPLTATPAAGHTLLWYTTATGGSGDLTAPTPSTASAGSTIYYVSQVNSTTNCEGPRRAITVTVNPSPNITGHTLVNPAQCGASNGSITLTGLTPNTSYTVHYIRNGSAVTVTLSSNASGQIIITGLNAGNYTNIYVVLNNCPSNEIPSVTLSDPSSPAAPSASSNSPVCSGQTLTFSSTPVAGATWNWSGPNAFSSTLAEPTITNVTTAASGTYNVSVTVNGCTSPGTSVNVLVNQTPATPVVNSNSPVCSGETINLNGPTVAGVSYSWSGPGGFSSTDEDPVITNATTAHSGSYTLTLTATEGSCVSQPGSTNVVVNPTPAISGASASQPSQCNSTTGSITLQGLTANTTYTVSYIRNSSTVTTTITSDGTGALTITGLNAGNYSNIFVTLAGCPSNAVGPFTLTDPTPPDAPVVSSNTPVCSGQTIQLNANTATPGSATYSWNGPNGFSSNEQNPQIINAPVAATGNYTVTATINGCTSPVSTTAVTVNLTPADPVASSNSPVCTGGTINLNASSATPGVSFQWNGPSGFSNTNQNPSITSAVVAQGGTYSVIVTNPAGGCTSSAISTNVVVNPTPVIGGVIPSDPTACNTATGSLTLTGLTANASYNISYIKNGSSQNVTLTANSAGEVVITGLTAGTYTDIVVQLTGCSSAPAAGPFVLSDPNPPSAPDVTGSNNLCSGSTLTLQAINNSPGAPTYSWSGPNGFISTSQNPVITGITTAASGTYSVTITIASCVSLPGTITVVVDSTPVIPVITSNGPVCSDSTLNLSASTITSGTITWQWSGPAGFSSSQQSPSIPNTTPANAGNYSVIATNVSGNCPSQPGTANVVINPTPVISGTSFTNPTQCNTPTGTVTIQGLQPGSTYAVNYLYNGSPQTISLVANGSGNLIIPNLPAGNYTNIYVVINNCRSLPVASVTLTDPTPPPAPTVNSNSPVCEGQTLNMQVATNEPGVPTYNWTGPDGFISTSATPSIATTTAASAGTYQVTVTINNCTSPAASLPVVINPLPPAPSVITPVNYCINTTSVPLTATPAPGNPLNWYDVPAGGTLLPSAPIPSTAIAGTTSYYVSQTNSFGCEGPRDTIDVIINPDALAELDPTDTIGCPPFVLTPSIVGLVDYPALNGNYEWYANNVLIGTGTIFPGYTILNENSSVIIKVKAISPFGCKPDSVSQVFNTYNLPHPSFEVIDSVGCGPLDVLVLNTTPNIGLFTYHWDFGNGQTSTQQQPGTITFNPNPTHYDTVYNVSLQIFSICDIITVVKTVRVKSKPRALFTPSATTGCSPMNITFYNTSAGNNNTYYWDLGDGTTYTTTSNDPVHHVYHTGIVDTFTVQLVAVNECGADTIAYDIIVSPNTIDLLFAVNGPQNSGCAPHTVSFINNTVGASTFSWDFGDGNILSTTEGVDTVDHVYLVPGIYNVSLTAQNSCSDTTAQMVITVYPKPDADFTASSYTICQGLQVNFTNNSSGGTSYVWTFGDGNTSTLVNPVHTYVNPGIYTVKLLVYSANAPGSVCVDSTEQQIQVTSQAEGSFSMDPSNAPCAPLTVTFANQNLPSVTASWDFGDGTTGSGNNTTHTYTLPGSYTVTLTVTVPGGCTYISTQVVTVNGPQGSLAYTSGYHCSPNTVRLEATGTGYTDITWDFGDGQTLTTTQLVVFHQYQNPGVYLPSVSFNNAAGCIFPVNGTDSIRIDKVDAGFTTSISQVCGNTRVIFTDTSHIFYGISNVQWNFGDGQTGSGSQVTHDYTASGTYPVQMIITGNSGCADTIELQLVVQVNTIPDVQISGPSTACTGEPVIFTGQVTSIDPVGILDWSISNGVTATGADLNYTFATSGIFTIRFIAGTTSGCYDTTYHNITVNPSPIVTASADGTICLGNNVPLNAAGALNYQWAPSAGLSCTTCPDPVATPTITTPYTVTGTNSFGCSDIEEVIITVIQPLNMTVSPSDSICIGESLQLVASGAATYQWSPAAGLSATDISNPVATPQQTTIYRVVGYDGFNCFTDTAFVLVGVGQYPTIDLGPDLTLATGTIHPLNSTVTNGPVGTWMWTPSTDLSCNTCPLPSAFIKKDITYIVNIENVYGCAASDTINIKVFCEESQVFIPNAFTPDGDGINDILMVRGKGIVSVRSFRIFNRWGEVVFEKANFAPNLPAFGWDGRIKGVVGPPDVFVYTADVVCENGQSFIYKGNVSILK